MHAPTPASAALLSAQVNSTATASGCQSQVEATYLSREDIFQAVVPYMFCGKAEEVVKFQWKEINIYRKYVPCGTQKAFSEIIRKNLNGDQPFIEIGSGIGYSFDEDISNRMVKTQASLDECKLLRGAIPASEPIYQMTIEDLHKSLQPTGKKVSLFCGIDVFDTMSSNVRKLNLKRLSELQAPGDRIVMMLDTNPELDEIFIAIRDSRPGQIIFPYFPLDGTDKLLFICVPALLCLAMGIDTRFNLLEMMKEEHALRIQGQATGLQVFLFENQEQLNLEVIDVELFYLELVKKDLSETGYETKVYNHVAFAPGDFKIKNSNLKQAIILKSQSTLGTVRQWDIEDKRFHTMLKDKGCEFPKDFNEEFLANMKKNNKILQGVQVVVLEATKLATP